MGRVEPGTFRHPPLFTCLQIETMQIALIDIAVECIDMIPRIEDLSPIFRACVGVIRCQGNGQEQPVLICGEIIEIEPERAVTETAIVRSEEQTPELQSRGRLV